MIGTRAALRYAKATLDLAKEKGCAEKVNEDMKLIQSTIEENPDLDILLKSPVIKQAQKKSVLIKIFEKKVNEITLSLLKLLVTNRRLEILILVAKEYIVIYDILKRVQESIDNKVSLVNIIDPSIIGGFILRVGDKQYDSSVSYRLKDLLSKFEDNQYISKI